MIQSLLFKINEKKFDMNKINWNLQPHIYYNKSNIEAISAIPKTLCLYMYFVLKIFK